MPRTLHPLLCAAALAAFSPAAHAADADRAADLIARLGLTETRFESQRLNPDLRATLPEGPRIEIEFHRDGTVEEIEALDGAAFPAAAIAPILPAALLASPDWPAEARLWSIEFDDDGVEIEGVSPDGRPFEAAFAPDGRLLDLSYGD